LLIFFMMQFYEVGTGYETWGLSDGYDQNDLVTISPNAC